MPLAEGAAGRAFEEIEVTKVCHHLHANGATEIIYHSRFLVGGGEFVIVIFNWIKDGESSLVSFHDKQTLESQL